MTLCEHGCGTDLHQDERGGIEAGTENTIHTFARCQAATRAQLDEARQAIASLKIERDTVQDAWTAAEKRAEWFRTALKTLRLNFGYGETQDEAAIRFIIDATLAQDAPEAWKTRALKAESIDNWDNARRRLLHGLYHIREIECVENHDETGAPCPRRMAKEAIDNRPCSLCVALAQDAPEAGKTSEAERSDFAQQGSGASPVGPDVTRAALAPAEAPKSRDCYCMVCLRSVEWCRFMRIT
jgi:hypothetical protein